MPSRLQAGPRPPALDALSTENVVALASATPDLAACDGVPGAVCGGGPPSSSASRESAANSILRLALPSGFGGVVPSVL